jgi:glycosyltransferase involved in cell wall biosynthesis
LFDLLAATTGGQATRAEEFLRRFRAYAPKNRLVVVKDSDSLSFLDGAAGWEVINVPIGAGRLKAFRRMAWENLILPQLIRKEQLNVYLTFSHYLPLMLRAGVHYVVGVSNLSPFSAEAWGVEGNAVRLKMWLLRHTLISSAKRADQVIALSNTCKRVLAKFGVEESKISVIPNGVEICRTSAEGISASNLPCSLPYILSVSHFYRYKNFETLIKAFSLLPQQHQERFSLVIVGKPYDAKYFNEVNGLISRLGLVARVYIIPGVDRAHLDLLYRNAALFVFPSLIENCPNILLEAMAYGLPIVASNIEPMPEFGSDGIRYFEGLSATNLASKMSEILSDVDDTEDLRRRAKIRANDFSWDDFTKRVVDVCAKTDSVIPIR